MSGLVAYGSSDDEDDIIPKVTEASVPVSFNVCSKTTFSLTTQATDCKCKSSTEQCHKWHTDWSVSIFDMSRNTDKILEHEVNKQLPGSAELSVPEEGPVIGPTIPIDVVDHEPLEGLGELASPQSPYSVNRALLRDLTLPTVPNYDIPQSPPGSPVQSTNAKFKQFLKLKKQGVHFNEKLANSAAMKNPSLMQKLMDFADLDETEQYETSLSPALWNPADFPERAFKEQLSKSQQRILKKREEERLNGQRESIDFVSASASGTSSRNGTPGIASRNGPKSAAERIMAGLDRGTSNSPQSGGVKRKSRFDA